MAGWFKTELPQGSMIPQLIEKGNAFTALSNSMGQMMDVVDNRAKEKYTSSALEKLKGITNPQEMLTAMQGIDYTKLNKEGAGALDRLSKNIQLQDAFKRQGLQDTLTKLQIEKAQQPTEMEILQSDFEQAKQSGNLPANINTVSAYGEWIKNFGKASTNNVPDDLIKMKQLGFPLTPEGYLKYKQSGLKQTSAPQGYAVDTFGRMYNKITGEFVGQGTNQQGQSQTAGQGIGITSKTPTRMMEDGRVVYVDMAGNPIKDFSGNDILVKIDPDNPEAIKKAEGTKKENIIAKNTTVLDNINEVKNIVKEGNLTSGIGAMIAQYVPSSDAYDAQELIKSITANIGFDRLQQMRDESPTGGALGQVSVMELEQLQASIASLNLLQSKDQFLRNLGLVEKRYTDIMNKFKAYPNAEKYGITGGKSETNTFNVDEARNKYQIK